MGFIKMKILFPVILLGAMSCNDNSLNNKKTSESEVWDNKVKKLPFAVTAPELCSDFSNNLTYALQKYQGNIIELSGTIRMVQKAKEDDCDYFTLNCDTNDPDALSVIIKCCFDNSTVSADTFRIGATITILAAFKEIDQNVVLLEKVDNR